MLFKRDIQSPRKADALTKISSFEAILASNLKKVNLFLIDYISN